MKYTFIKAAVATFVFLLGGASSFGQSTYHASEVLQPGLEEIGGFEEMPMARLNQFIQDGNTGAQIELARRYRLGEGVVRNPEHALNMLQSIAVRGRDSNAALELGLIYFYGLGAAQNEALAFKWMLLSSLQGNPEAPAYIGMMYLNGSGVKQDETQAVDYYLTGAARGDGYARELLIGIIRSGKASPRQAIEAYASLDSYFDCTSDEEHAIYLSELETGMTADQIAQAKAIRPSTHKGIPQGRSRYPESYGDRLPFDGRFYFHSEAE